MFSACAARHGMSCCRKMDQTPIKLTHYARRVRAGNANLADSGDFADDRAGRRFVFPWGGLPL